MTREQLIIWAAGFLEGEGSFASRNGRCVTVSAAQCELAPLERLQAMFGGRIYGPRAPKTSKHRPVWTWQVHAEAAMKAMEELLPFMVTEKRRSEIDRCRVSEERYTTPRTCIQCGGDFVPKRRAQKQILCGSAECRRAYATDWQRAKRAAV